MNGESLFSLLGIENSEWLYSSTLGIAHGDWLFFLACVFAGLVLKKSSHLLVIWAKRFTRKTSNSFDDAILDAVERPLGGILASLFWIVCASRVELSEDAGFFLEKGLQILLSFYLIFAAYRLTDVLADFLDRLSKKTENELDDHLVPLISKTLKVFVVVFGSLVTIQNLGVNVLSLLAGLGLGGLAFALAAKDTAANLFGSLMIIIDRPFKVGDWIVVDDAEGTVEEIGLRSTRIRTFYNSQVSIPNSKTANVDIDNMGRREFRRVYVRLGITYSSTVEKVEAFRSAIRDIITAHPHTRKDNFHVYFNNYADSSLEIMVYFFLKTPDWASELKCREEILLEIMRAAEKVGVSFAFPTRSLHLETPVELENNAPK